MAFKSIENIIGHNWFRVSIGIRVELVKDSAGL
jgi:hypothetical protein